MHLDTLLGTARLPSWRGKPPLPPRSCGSPRLKNPTASPPRLSLERGSKSGPRICLRRAVASVRIRLPCELDADGMGRERASAVQLVGGLRNLAALVAGPLELVRGRQARAIAAGDRRGAVGRAAGNRVKRHLPGMAVIETDHHHAEVQQIGDDGEQRRLLSAMLRGVDVNAPPTLPCSAPRIQSPPAWSRKLAICDGSRPNRVPAPTMIAS